MNRLLLLSICWLQWARCWLRGRGLPVHWPLLHSIRRAGSGGVSGLPRHQAVPGSFERRRPAAGTALVGQGLCWGLGGPGLLCRQGGCCAWGFWRLRSLYNASVCLQRGSPAQCSLAACRLRSLLGAPGGSGLVGCSGLLLVLGLLLLIVGHGWCAGPWGRRQGPGCRRVGTVSAHWSGWWGRP